MRVSAPKTRIGEASLLSEADFEARFREHAPRVYGICLRLLGDADRATDAAQMTFVRAWQRANQFRAGSNYGAWIASIATTVALNHLRAESRRGARAVMSGDDPARMAAPGVSPDLRLMLEEGIALLPPATRSVFVLHDIEGYSPEEISRALSIAPVTVRVHVHKARRFLRVHLAR